MIPFAVSSQNVGISGDINFIPSTTFDIDGGLRIRNFNSGVITSNSTGVLSSTNGSTGQVLGSGPTWVDPKTFSWTINGNDNTSVSTNFIGTTNATGIAFRTDGVERMRLQSSGQLTIGSTQVGGKLDVHQSANNDVARFTTYGHVNSILLRRAQTSSGSLSPTSGINTVLGRFDFEGYNGASYTAAGRIEVVTDATGGTSTDMPGRLSFSTTADGTGVLIERMVIKNNGNIGIGIMTPSERLDVSDNIRSSGIVYWGNAGVRTETRNDAGLQGNVGSRSGFFETSTPTPAANWPTGSSGWWHLLDVRHSNNTNNYAMQIAGSFFDQDLYYRKTNGSATTGWSKLMTTVSPIDQGYSSVSNTSEILLIGNNTGTFSYGLNAGWAVGTWQSTVISVTRTITPNCFVMVTVTARIEGDNYNRCPPSSAYFRINRGGTIIGSTAVFTRYNTTGGHPYISSNLSMSFIDDISGTQTYTLEFWLTNDNNACSVESVAIGDYQLNVVQIKK